MKTEILAYFLYHAKYNKNINNLGASNFDIILNNE